MACRILTESRLEWTKPPIIASRARDAYMTPSCLRFPISGDQSSSRETGCRRPSRETNRGVRMKRSTGRAGARLAHTLLDLASDFGVRDSAGILIPLRLNQGDLGNLVGLARETVNIILQDFRSRDLIEIDRQSIRIKDPDRLRSVA